MSQIWEMFAPPFSMDPESKTNKFRGNFSAASEGFPHFLSLKVFTVHAGIKTCQIDKCLELENLHEFAR